MMQANQGSNPQSSACCWNILPLSYSRLVVALSSVEHLFGVKKFMGLTTAGRAWIFFEKLLMHIFPTVLI